MGKEKPPPFIINKTGEPVFVWEPTKPQSSGGDSNPAAILANYSGNHSVSFSDATYLRGWLLLYHRPSVSRSLLSLTLNLAFQPFSLRCLFIIVTKIFKETHQPIIIHPQSSLKATNKNQYESSLFFTFFHFFYMVARLDAVRTNKGLTNTPKLCTFWGAQIRIRYWIGWKQPSEAAWHSAVCLLLVVFPS